MKRTRSNQIFHKLKLYIFSLDDNVEGRSCTVIMNCDTYEHTKYNTYLASCEEEGKQKKNK